METQLVKPGCWAQVQRASVERLHIRLESFVVLLVLSAAMALLSPFFLSLSNFLNILLATSTIGVLAIARDLRHRLGRARPVARFGHGAGRRGRRLRCGQSRQAPSLIGLAACIAAGAIAGYINGQLITRAFVPAFIVTLGMLGLARGFALVISGGRVIYGLPPLIVYVGQGRPFGIPTPVIILVLTAIIAHCVLAYTRFGRHTLALGDSEGAARAAGIRVERHRRMLYTLSGALAGLAGMLFMARINSGDPTAGINYELTAITAAIIGGTNLFGGRGSILGTMIGALIMGVLQNGLNLLAVQSYYQQMAIGAVLILAVFIDQYQIRKESRV